MRRSGQLQHGFAVATMKSHFHATSGLQAYAACLCNHRSSPPSCEQVLMLIRQMEATATTALAGSVSLLCIGHQAILDAYLCLLHLTTGAARSSACGLFSQDPAWEPHDIAPCA